MKKRGFTLVELLAVLLVISILMVIAVPNILKMSDRMKKRGLEKEIEAVEDAAVIYAQDNSNKLKTEWSQKNGVEKCTETNPQNCDVKKVGDCICYCKKAEDCKYIITMKVSDLINLKAYTPEDGAEDLSSYTVTIRLDDDYKSATAKATK